MGWEAAGPDKRRAADTCQRLLPRALQNYSPQLSPSCQSHASCAIQFQNFASKHSQPQQPQPRRVIDKDSISSRNPQASDSPFLHLRLRTFIRSDRQDALRKYVGPFPLQRSSALTQLSLWGSSPGARHLQKDRYVPIDPVHCLNTPQI